MTPNVALPAILLLMAFLLKLFIDRSASGADVSLALLELPVDIAFLATSLIAGFTIANPPHVVDGVLSFTAYIAASVIVIVFWRRSRRWFAEDKLWRAGVLGVLNHSVCVYGLVRAVAMVEGPSGG